jgi:hypothetical protein
MNDEEDWPDHWSMISKQVHFGAQSSPRAILFHVAYSVVDAVHMSGSRKLSLQFPRRRMGRYTSQAALRGGCATVCWVLRLDLRFRVFSERNCDVEAALAKCWCYSRRMARGKRTRGGREARVRVGRPEFISAIQTGIFEIATPGLGPIY